LHILVGITGGIAAYKSASIVRGFSELGHVVKALPTQNALRFIGATTLEALSHNVVDSDLYSDVESVKHIALAQEADLIVVAPATAAFLARYASGLADDLLLNVLLATNAKVVVAPAMHSEMWQHPTTIENVAKLRNRGVLVVEPDSGRLTGNDSGVGRLPEPAEIVRSALAFYSSGLELANKRFLVVAGGTREPIDAVRFVGNSSSGKQGLALAEAAKDRGAEVSLIAINMDIEVSSFPNTHKAKTTSDVQALLEELGPHFDCILMPAAISDYRVVNPASGKLHRAEQPTLELHLVANPDLLSNLVSSRTSTSKNQVIVGFAAEVLQPGDSLQALQELAKAKLDRKGVDVMVANDVSGGSVFSSETNEVVMVGKDLNPIDFAGTKYEVAMAILDYIKPLLANL
jgi:phosphopantothenoylcysteine decarboxylase/phosphopantothenate--cysteine ligase